MTSLLSPVRRHAVLPALMLLAAPVVADAVPPQKARPRAAGTGAARAVAATGNGGVIALPLVPVVPAAQRTCASRTLAGLGYTMLRPGSGAMPDAGATVLVNYIGYLAATGAVFDQNMRTPLSVGGVIPGFGQGLRMMARGSIVRLCIPAAMGYGAEASGPIPANADLVFQVELLDFRTAAEMDAMRKAQMAEPPASGTSAEPPAPAAATPQR